VILFYIEPDTSVALAGFSSLLEIPMLAILGFQAESKRMLGGSRDP
jgi:hypothetical protein